MGNDLSHVTGERGFLTADWVGQLTGRSDGKNAINERHISYCHFSTGPQSHRNYSNPN